MHLQVFIFGYALRCTTLRVVEITTRSVVQLNLPTQVFRLDNALARVPQQSFELQFFPSTKRAYKTKRNVAYRGAMQSQNTMCLERLLHVTARRGFFRTMNYFYKIQKVANDLPHFGSKPKITSSKITWPVLRRIVRAQCGLAERGR